MFIFEIEASPGEPPIVGGGTNFVGVNTASSEWEANGLLYLPGVPEIGVRIFIHDSGGVADVKPILVSGSGFLVDTLINFTIQNPFETLQVVYNGSKWVVVT